MKTRTLGTQGLTVSELGLGCMGLTKYTYGEVDEQSQGILDRLNQAAPVGVTSGARYNEKLMSAID